MVCGYLTDNDRMTVLTAAAGRRAVGAALLALLLGVLLGAARAQAVTPAPTRSVPVGQPPRLPLGSARRGALAASTALRLQVLLSPRDPAAIAALVSQISTPGSPNFRHYLRAGEFSARFGATPEIVAAVDAALRDAGLVPGPVSADRLSIPVTATAATTQRAFAISLQRFQAPDGRTVYANTSAPKVRASVAAAVTGVVGLSDVAIRHPAQATGAPPRPSRPHAVSPRASSSGAGPQPCTAARAQASGTGPYTIDQLASAYAFTGLYSAGDLGAGVTVGVYELEPNLTSDIAAYQGCFSTSAQVTYRKVDGGPPSSDPAAGSGEAALDIETVIGLAQASNVVVYQGPNNATGPLDTYRQMINDNQAKVITTSWGACEAQISLSEQQAESTLFAQAAVQGQTIVAASGDTGSEDCVDPTTGKTVNQLAVDDPASQPNVTGVGGTRLSSSSSPTSQTVWNDPPTPANPSANPPTQGNPGGAGGGGLSTTWATPAYQSTSGGPGVHNVYSNGRRQVPDVSADADPSTGYVVYHKGSWAAFGGTSAAAPLWAGLTALAEASSSCASKSPLGLLNPSLYRVAAGSAAASAFTDVTAGDNDFTALQTGDYPATAGYDLASGLGTPIATSASGNGLVSQLCGYGAPKPSPTPGSTPSQASAASAPPTAGSTSPTASASASSSAVSAAATAFGVPPAVLAQAGNAPIRGLRLALRRRGRTLVLGSASCPSACRVAVDVRALSPVAHGTAGRGSGASVHVGTLTVTVARHRSRRLTVRMSAASLRLLRSHHRLQVTLMVRVRDEYGRLHTQKRTMSLRFSGQ